MDARDGSRARSTSPAATSSRGSSRRRPIAPSRSSSTARRQPLGLRARSRSRSSATRTSSSLAGGYTDWKRNGFPTELPRTLDGEKRAALQPAHADSRRSARRASSGCSTRASSCSARAGSARRRRSTSRRPASARLGIVDDDRVDASNLQRQVVHSTGRLGEWKAESAKRTLEELNPDVEVVPYIERLTSENVERILADGWDVIVDGADNFPTRYLINDAAVWHDIPLVHGSIYRFEGQATVFKPQRRPVLPLPLPAAAAARARAELRRGRRARRPAGHRRLAAGERGAEALPRDRRAARRPPPPLRRARDRVQRGQAPPRPELPGLRRLARPSPSTSTTSSSAAEGRRTHEQRPHPTQLRTEVGGAREVPAEGGTVRELLDDLMDRFPALRPQLVQRRRDRAVRERLRRGRGRPHARRARHLGRARLRR